MIFLPRQAVRGFSTAIALLSLDLICSCKPTTSSPREDLVRSLSGANLEGFEFATKEAGAEEISSFTNPAVRKLISLGGGDTNLVLRYTRISARAANTAKTYKTEIARQGAALTLLVTNLGTNEVVSKETFPAPAASHNGGFETLSDCLKEFDCVNRGPLQCEANRTCKNQFAALTCCLKSGECFSVHLVIPPTTHRCDLLEMIPDLEGIVLSQQRHRTIFGRHISSQLLANCTASARSLIATDTFRGIRGAYSMCELACQRKHRWFEEE